MKTIHDNRQPKTAWSFNLKTGIVSGDVEIHPDPNDASNYLVPRGVTTIEPPKEKSGYVNIWNGEKWVATKTPKV